MIVRVVALIAVAACCASSALAQKVMTFAKGAAEVTLPDAFVATEQNDGTLRAVFGPAGNHRLEFARKEAVARAGGVNLGEAFVRAEAKRKDLKLFEMPGKVVYMEPAPDRTEGDVVYRTAHWHIGFGNSIVVMTLTAPAEASPELKQFLGKPLNNVIASVRRKRA
jgi:hypothetical protein